LRKGIRGDDKQNHEAERSKGLLVYNGNLQTSGSQRPCDSASEHKNNPEKREGGSEENRHRLTRKNPRNSSTRPRDHKDFLPQSSLHKVRAK